MVAKHPKVVLYPGVPGVVRVLPFVFQQLKLKFCPKFNVVTKGGRMFAVTTCQL